MRLKNGLAGRLGLLAALSAFGSLAWPEVAAAATDTLAGIEVSPGVIIGDVRVGTAFVGQAAGDLPGRWAVTIRYTPPHPGANVTNNILGGTWALEVWRQRRLVGTIYGTVESGGQAVWDEKGIIANLKVPLIIRGGTGKWRNASGTGTFDGRLSHAYVIPRIKGTLILDLK